MAQPLSAAAPAACIVLAGGLGTRLRSAVPDRPKCLAPVGARSFLEIQLQALHGQGVRHVLLSLGHLSGQVLEAARGWGHLGLRIDTVVEPAPLGTGGAVRYALDALAALPDRPAGEPADEAWVINGDTFLAGDLAAMHRPLALAEGEWFRLASVEVPDRARYGGLALAPAEGHGPRRVSGFLEKGQQGPGPINAGLYRLNRRAFGLLAQALPGATADTAFSLESVLMPALVAQGALRAQAIDGEFIDIGVPEDYHRFCRQHGAGG